MSDDVGPSSAGLLSSATEHQLERLLGLRRALRAERRAAATPAIAHALRLSETYLHLALGYCGHTADLFPEEDLAGEDLAGEDLAGEDLAGEDLAGEDLAGEDLAGEDLAGEDLAGEDLAGEDLAGEGPSGGGKAAPSPPGGPAGA